MARSVKKSPASALAIRRIAGAVVRRAARRKAEWVTLWNTPCATVTLAAGDPCPSGGALQLVTNNMLRTSLGDSCRILKMQGNLYFQPSALLGGTPVTLNGIATANGLMNLYIRAGLLKSETTSRNGGIPEAVEPLSGTWSPGPDQFTDWTEQNWLRTWEHNWPPHGLLTSGASQVNGCCSVVTGGAGAIENGITWTVTEGAIDTSIETECTTCGDATVPNNAFQASIARHPWQLRLSTRRPILLKENDSLDLWFGWENLQGFGETVRREQPFLNMWGGVKALIER